MSKIFDIYLQKNLKNVEDIYIKQNCLLWKNRLWKYY